MPRLSQKLFYEVNMAKSKPKLKAKAKTKSKTKPRVRAKTKSKSKTKSKKFKLPKIEETPELKEIFDRIPGIVRQQKRIAKHNAKMAKKFDHITKMILKNMKDEE